MTRVVAAAVLAGALLVAPAASAASSSTVLGCGAYEGAVKKLGFWYARVYNACGSAKKMRAVAILWPDGPCEWVGAYSRADLYAGVQAPSGTADC